MLEVPTLFGNTSCHVLLFSFVREKGQDTTMINNRADTGVGAGGLYFTCLGQCLTSVRCPKTELLFELVCFIMNIFKLEFVPQLFFISTLDSLKKVCPLLYWNNKPYRMELQQYVINPRESQEKKTWIDFLQVEKNRHSIFIWLLQKIHGEENIFRVVRC